MALKFTDEGAKAFGDATTRLYQTGGTISIWLDDENVSTASVNAAITDGSAIITSSASSPSRRRTSSRWPARSTPVLCPLR
ncbi:MAG: SecDF P1 head subdomain-containing protein [Faecalibacterium prausnitzii]